MNKLTEIDKQLIETYKNDRKYNLGGSFSTKIMDLIIHSLNEKEIDKLSMEFPEYVEACKNEIEKNQLEEKDEKFLSLFQSADLFNQRKLKISFPKQYEKYQEWYNPKPKNKKRKTKTLSI